MSDAPIKMRLAAKGRIPHGGGWHIVDPFTGVRIFAVTWDQLMIRVIEQRKANGAPIGSELEQEVEQWCCIAHPDEAEVIDERIPRKRNFTLDEITRGTKTMLSFVANGSPIVSQEEANRRAAICLRCPLNVMWSQSCSLCEKLGDLARGIIGAVHTDHDQNLFSCAICGCYLKSAVHLPLDILNKANTPEMDEAFRVAKTTFNCWHTS